jgi:2-polyprenyl-3-methyl-5-hydroxy-6-metoxy-1,4-benzoquinol methylase
VESPANQTADPAETLARAVQLGTSVDALAALAAYLRIETEGLPADPAVHDLLRQVAAEVLGSATPAADAGTAPVIGLARTFLRQGAELIENPGRSGGWDQVDVPLLQAIGRLSMGIADAVRAAETVLDGLGPALAQPGARFLDVGTGTGWLAVALARAYPSLQVVGIDIFEPALELARKNVADAGLSDRVTLERQDATALAERAAYDAVWLPLPFLPKAVVPAVVAASSAALKPGGWLLPGTFAGPPDRLSQLLTDLRTVRSGGYPWPGDELMAALTEAGLAEAQEVPRTWPAPVRLYAARRPR